MLIICIGSKSFMRALEVCTRIILLIGFEAGNIFFLRVAVYNCYSTSIYITGEIFLGV